MDSNSTRPFAATDSEAYADPSASSGTSPPRSNSEPPGGGTVADPEGWSRSDAERFIEALAGSANAQVTFQTFHDSIKGGGGCILHGTLNGRS
jgi:hypothetical protein